MTGHGTANSLGDQAAVGRYFGSPAFVRPEGPFTFARLLAPSTVETFCDEYWAARPMHVVRGISDFYDDLISLAELERLFAIDGFFARHLATTPERGMGAPDPPPSSVSEVYERLAGGASLRLRKLETVLDSGRPIIVLLRDIARILGHPCESLSCYVAPAGARGLGPHHDETEILRCRSRVQNAGSFISVSARWIQGCMMQSRLASRPTTSCSKPAIYCTSRAAGCTTSRS